MQSNLFNVFVLDWPVDPGDPAGPVGPVDPVDPSRPVGPVAPAAPVAPVRPSGPAGPVMPVAPDKLNKQFKNKKLKYFRTSKTREEHLALARDNVFWASHCSTTYHSLPVSMPPPLVPVPNSWFSQLSFRQRYEATGTICIYNDCDTGASFLFFLFFFLFFFFLGGDGPPPSPLKWRPCCDMIIQELTPDAADNTVSCFTSIKFVL